jgi:hypothetical protein
MVRSLLAGALCLLALLAFVLSIPVLTIAALVQEAFRCVPWPRPACDRAIRKDSAGAF